MPKIRTKSLIHENADANITCDFGDSDIRRSSSRLPHTHIVSSILVRWLIILPPHVGLSISLMALSSVLFMSHWHMSFHLVFGCPVFLISGTYSICFQSLSSLCLLLFSSHVHIISVIPRDRFPACVTLIVPRMCLLLILSLNVTLPIHFSILIAFPSIVDLLYPTFLRYTALLAGSLFCRPLLLLHRHPSVAQCISSNISRFSLAPSQFVISVSIAPSSSTIILRYLKCILISGSSSSIITGSLFPWPFCLKAKSIICIFGRQTIIPLSCSTFLHITRYSVMSTSLPPH